MVMMDWVVFGVVVLVMLWIDLGVKQRHAHAISIREAAVWSIVWVSVSLAFCGWVALTLGRDKALEFLAAYLIEKSLSVDNMFVFVVVFTYFHIPPLHQPRILKWGILGALGMRLVLIMAGVALLHTFHWLLYVFGAILVFTGVKMLVGPEKPVEPDKNPVLKLLRRCMPLTTEITGERFFIKQGLRWAATPLFATLLVVEVTDLVFAVDSIPAVLAISSDPFIVYTSNVFAILGLRALYFLLSGIMGLFRYLKVGISLILCFVGVKMLITDIWHVPISMSLGVIAGILTVAIVASLLHPVKDGTPHA